MSEYLDKFCIAYLDDIIIYSRTREEHTGHVRKILAALQSRNLRCKLSKCEFGVSETVFLGFVISSQGLRLDPEKLKAVKDWPVPTTVKGVRGFLGFANFIKKFIKGYSKIAELLIALIRKNQGFK